MTRLSYTVMSLFPAIYAVRWMQRQLGGRSIPGFTQPMRSPQADIGHPGALANRLLVTLLARIF